MAMTKPPQLRSKNAWPCATKTERYRNIPRGSDNLVARGYAVLWRRPAGFCWLFHEEIEWLSTSYSR
jgi:hypothetical protein